MWRVLHAHSSLQDRRVHVKSRASHSALLFTSCLKEMPEYRPPFALGIYGCERDILSQQIKIFLTSPGVLFASRWKSRGLTEAAQHIMQSSLKPSSKNGCSNCLLSSLFLYLSLFLSPFFSYLPRSHGRSAFHPLR